MKKQITQTTKNGETLIIKLSTDGSSTGSYFSITGDLYKAGKPLTDRSIISCGRMHGEILSARPNLKPFVDLHLSNLDGVPMHSVENGFYWLAKVAEIPIQYAPDQNIETCFSYLCDHLRISEQEGKGLVKEISLAYKNGKAKIATSEEEQHKQGVFDAKNLFKNRVEEMKPRWKQEAEAAILFLETL